MTPQAERISASITSQLSVLGEERASSEPRLFVSTDGEKLIVEIPRTYGFLRQACKDLGGRLDKRTGTYAFPLYIAYVRAIDEASRSRAAYSRTLKPIVIDDSVMEWIAAAFAVAHPDGEPALRIPAWLKPTWDRLYNFQKHAVAWLVENPYGHPGGLLALSPGLGKTVVSMLAARLLGADRVLIVSPLSLLRTWQVEHEKWIGETSKCAQGYTDEYGDYHTVPRLSLVHGDSPPETGWVVTNYHTITGERFAAEFWDRHWDVLILDESVMVKNRKTHRFNVMKSMREAADLVWLLSGSPITKHPDDLWTQFHLIDPKSFPSYWRFTKRWATVEQTTWGVKVSGASGRNFHKDFGDILYAKHQEEVLPELPEMRFETIETSMTHRQDIEYTRMLNEFVAILDSGEQLTAKAKLAQLIRLQQISSNLCNLGASFPDTSGKHEAIMEMLEVEDAEFPMLIWTHWRPGATALAEKITNAFPKLRVSQIHGGLTADETDYIFDTFKAGKIDVLVLSLEVGKFGHTMTKTKTIVYCDKTWSADAWVQSLARVRRIGLTHSPRVISLVNPGSVDEMVEDNLAGKAINIAHISNADLSRMLRSLSLHRRRQNDAA